MTDLVDIEDIKTFDWKELDGKTVRVYVWEEEGIQTSALYDEESEEFFVVSIKTLGGNNG